MSMHNAIRAKIIDIVQADAQLMDLIKGNVYPRSMAELGVDDPYNDLTFPMITFRVVGSGSTTFVVQPLRINIVVQSWSQQDYDQAWEVADRLRIVLRGACLEGPEATGQFMVTNAGQEVMDPTQQLYYIVQQFVVDGAGLNE